MRHQNDPNLFFIMYIRQSRESHGETAICFKIICLVYTIFYRGTAPPLADRVNGDLSHVLYYN